MDKIETKEELLIYKSALEKLLDKIHYIGTEKGMCWGLCLLSSRVLTSDEKGIFDKRIERYSEIIGVDTGTYFWEKGQQEPRKEWLEYELSIVYHNLKQYE